MYALLKSKFNDTTVTVVAYAEFENIIEVDRGRNVIFDFGVWILRVLRRHLKDFDGVFSVDTLPDNPRLLVVNTDPAHRPGQHRIAICTKDGRREFFDSLGRRPSVDFERYMNRRCSTWIFNDRQLQSVTSKFCGHNCICYCIFS